MFSISLGLREGCSMGWSDSEYRSYSSSQFCQNHRLPSAERETVPSWRLVIPTQSECAPMRVGRFVTIEGGWSTRSTPDQRQRVPSFLRPTRLGQPFPTAIQSLSAPTRSTVGDETLLLVKGSRASQIHNFPS